MPRKGAKPPKRMKASQPRAASASRRRSGARKPARAAGKVAARRSSHGEPARITLAADCTLREAAALKAQLITTISPTDAVLIDGGAVERIDTAGLQLLVAFAQREHAAGRRLQWQAASDALRSAGARLGLLGALSLSGG